MGYHLPAGINVAACASVLHQNPEHFPNPKQFRPERFIEKRFTGFEYIPFGGGYKFCLGNEFALLQVKVMIAVMLTRCRFEWIDQGPLKVVQRGLLFGPSTVRVRLTHLGNPFRSGPIGS